MPVLLNVEAGVDDEPKEFYDRGHTASVMGSHAFLHWLRKSQLREVEDKVLVAQVFPGSLAIAAIIPLVAAYYNVALAVLRQSSKDPRKGCSHARWPCIGVSSWAAFGWPTSCASLAYRLVDP